jgi:hypothetical protein
MIKDKLIALAIDEVGYVEGKSNFNKFARVAGHANNRALVQYIHKRDFYRSRA